MSITNELLPISATLTDVQILLVDNDLDSRYLYALLLEGSGAKVITMGSIQDALAILNWFIPDILICEIRFLGENVRPLIQEVRTCALSTDKNIPILAISTCPLTILAQYLPVKVEAYLLKPIDIDDFLERVCNLLQLSKSEIQKHKKLKTETN